VYFLNTLNNKQQYTRVFFNIPYTSYSLCVIAVSRCLWGRWTIDWLIDTFVA